MLDIRLLGGFEIRLADGSPTGRFGPEPQALLEFLAMRRGKPVSHGRLASLVWGERDEEQARHSLSQAFCAIRTALGPNAARLVQAGADGLALPRNELELDVDRFERAVGSHGPALARGVPSPHSTRSRGGIGRPTGCSGR
jgi:DNA-binding SARP family transcriptional activator